MAVELLAGEAKEGESNKAIIACNDYLRMGIGRSLRRLEEKYSEGSRKIAPTTSIGTLTRWSQEHDWQVRASEYDKAIDAEKTAIADARRKEMLESGLSQDFERIAELNDIYAKLKEEFIENGLWYTDTKLSSTGMSVDVEVFNKALIDSLRGVLDDLAKETGGRKQKVDMEHSGEIGTRVIEGPRNVR